MDLARLYERRFPARDRAAKAHIWRVIVRDFFQQWIADTDTVLDIGCGHGEFLNNVRAARRIGLDLNEETKGYLAREIEFHCGDARHLDFLNDLSVDVVFTSNFLEHLPSKSDVEQLLGESRRVLRDGGRLIALGPNLRVLPGKYWDFWDHMTPITDRSMIEVLEMIGFDIEVAYARFLPYTTRSRIPQAPWLVSLYLKSPVAWRFMGGQFLICARRR